MDEIASGNYKGIEHIFIRNILLNRMNKKIVLIAGITGQDGVYLTEYLIKKGYNFHGI